MRELINIIISLPPLVLSSDPAENARLLKALEKTSTAKAVKEQYGEAIDKYKKAVRPFLAALNKESSDIFGTDGSLSKAFASSGNDFLDPHAKNIALALILPKDKQTLELLAARCHEFSLLDHAENHKDETAMALPMRLTSLEVASAIKSDLPEMSQHSIFENAELHSTSDKKQNIAMKVAKCYVEAEEAKQASICVEKLKSACDDYASELDKALTKVLHSNEEYRNIKEIASTNIAFNKIKSVEEYLADDTLNFDDNQHRLIVEEILKTELDPHHHKALIEVVEKIKIVKELQQALNGGESNSAKLKQFEDSVTKNLTKLNKSADSSFKKFIDTVAKILRINTTRVAVKEATKSFLAGSSMFGGYEKVGSKREREPEPQNDGVKRQKR